MATKNTSLDETELSNGICPTCGREDFKSEHGVMIHHASAHGERLGFVDLECDQCGKEFERRRSNVSEYENDFCGEDCWGKYMESNYTGEDSPAYNGGNVKTSCSNCGKEIEKIRAKYERSELDYCSKSCAASHRSVRYTGSDHPNYNSVEVKCEVCGKELERIQSRTERYEYQFCSKECHGIWRSKNNCGEDNPNYNRIEVDCSTCGESMLRKPSTVREGSSQFCSKKCESAWRSERFSGPSSPTWKGGSRSRHGFDESLKEDVRSRDDYRCQDCGIENEEHLQKYNKQLHVHHIIPMRKFDNPENSNTMDNLVTFCIVCHRKWEQMAGLRPQ